MRLIDADKLSEQYEASMGELLKSTNCENISLEALSLLCGAKIIANAPTIDAEPVVHGKWVGKRYNWKTYEMEIIPYDPLSFEDLGCLTCSVCGGGALLNGHEEEVPSNYCPHCGARMA